MSILERVPLTKPDTSALGYFTESQSQEEYVRCIQLRVQFAASGLDGEWLYKYGDTILCLSPKGTKAYAKYAGLDWIREAQKLSPICE